MKRDPDKTRTYRIKVDDRGENILKQSVLNRMIMDNKPLRFDGNCEEDIKRIEGDCLVRICEEWMEGYAEDVG